VLPLCFVREKLRPNAGQRKDLRASFLFFAAFEIVGEAATGEEAIHPLEHVQPDMILMELLMPGMGGVAAIRAICTRDPQATIIVLTTDADGDQVQEGSRPRRASGAVVSMIVPFCGRASFE
jgi:DNA-binding NarL/FixJ family response regulator